MFPFNLFLMVGLLAKDAQTVVIFWKGGSRKLLGKERHGFSIGIVLACMDTRRLNVHSWIFAAGVVIVGHLAVSLTVAYIIMQ
jgi:sensor domain CHASE-containing protein